MPFLLHPCAWRQPTLQIQYAVDNAIGGGIPLPPSHEVRIVRQMLLHLQ